MGSMKEYEIQRDFMYLYERMSEPLGYGIYFVLFFSESNT